VPSVERFHINHVSSATPALICLVTLTFDLLTLKPLRVISRGMSNLPTNFDVSGTLTFDLEVMALVGDVGLRAPSVYHHVWSS